MSERNIHDAAVTDAVTHHIQVKEGKLFDEMAVNITGLATKVRVGVWFSKRLRHDQIDSQQMLSELSPFYT